MKHLSEEDLVLLYYGEPVEAEHLTGCDDCTARFEELQHLLNSLDAGVTTPERGELYGAEVWTKIKPHLARQPARKIPHWRVWGVIAAMLVVGFWLGRTTASPSKAVADSTVKERILLVALTDHLERSQMVLAELSNAEPGDLAYQRSQAEDLIDANRLYRLTAVANGNLAAASLLDDLERVLMDIAHAPDEASTGEVETLRQRIEDQGLSFKVKVFSTGMANQEKERL